MTTEKPANGNANPNNQPNDRGYFCPTCGGADVVASSLAGGVASCNICGWRGVVEGLPTFHFTHDGGTPEEVFRRFFIDMRKLLATQQFATSLGMLLIKWGFLDQPGPKNKDAFGKHLARYVGEAAKAIVASVAKTRADIERETHNVPSAEA